MKVTRAAGTTQCVLSLKGSVGRVQSAASCLTILSPLFFEPGCSTQNTAHTVWSVTWWNVEHYASGTVYEPSVVHTLSLSLTHNEFLPTSDNARRYTIVHHTITPHMYTWTIIYIFYYCTSQQSVACVYMTTSTNTASATTTRVMCK